jgi:hypothetical protein
MSPITLEQQTKPTGPMIALAETVGVSRESLYRMMSETGNPTYDSLRGILNAMGLKLEVVPLGDSRQPERTLRGSLNGLVTRASNPPTRKSADTTKSARTR